MNSNTWGLSLEGFGRINVGVDAIKQRIIIAVLTEMGSDPFRPTFGTNIYQMLDMPVNIALPVLRLEILRSVTRWVPEVEIISLAHDLIESHVSFNLTFTVPGLEGTHTVAISPIREGVDEVVLKALLPDSDAGNNYILNFIHEGDVVNPISPEYGFKSKNALFSFCQENYPSYGKWTRKGNSIAVHLKNGSVERSSLSVKVEKIFPFPLSDNGFRVFYTPNNRNINPVSMPLLADEESVLNWINDNWSPHGWWGLRYRTPEDGFFFTNDFNMDFERELGNRVLRFQPLEGNEGQIIIEGY